MAELEERHRRREEAGRATGPDSMREAIAALSQGMSALVRGHLALARVEMTRDVRALGRDTAVEMAGVPLLACAYLLLWFGIAYLLSRAMPAWASFFICAGVNLLGGLALMAWGGARRKRDPPPLAASTHELRQAKEWSSRLREPPGGTRAARH